MGVPATVTIPTPFRVLTIMEQKTCSGRVFPLTYAPASPGATFTDLVAAVKAHKADILSKAMAHGAVLLRGFTKPSAEAFAEVAEALTLEKFPYVGGAAPRTNVVRDVVFTTNESPPECPIPFHHEMAQVPSPPSYVMFYCETAPKVGGETPIILSEEVCNFFFANHAEFANKVLELGVKCVAGRAVVPAPTRNTECADHLLRFCLGLHRYVRVMPAEDDNESPIGRSWKSTFQCSTKEEAEAAMTKLGSTWEWLDNGDVRTVTATVPAIRTDERTGRRQFFNSMVAAFTGWIDSRNDPTKAVVLGDGSPVDAAAMASVAAFMTRERVQFKWAVGDVIIIDNRVAMHSRNPFERPRRILAALGGPSLDGHATTAIAPPKAAASGKALAPCVPLARTGDQMPVLGLGVWKIARDVTADTVVTALKAGYRHLDCACDYGNEKEVGEGIRRAIAEGVCTREELWVTSKLWNTFHSPAHVEVACRKTLSDLGLTYVDLYLIHFPISQRYVPIDTRYPPEWVHDPEAATPRMEYAAAPLHMTWPAMEALVDAGLTRNIGVCNMASSQLRDLLSYARLSPQVLQVELHPYNSQQWLLRMCKDAGITVTAFSPLGAGSYIELGMGTMEDSVLTESVLQPIAKRHGKSVAQVVLRWGVQRGTTVVAKSSKAHRLVENLSVFDFTLSDDDMAVLDGLDKGRRFNDPGAFTQFMNSFCPIYH